MSDFLGPVGALAIAIAATLLVVWNPLRWRVLRPGLFATEATHLLSPLAPDTPIWSEAVADLGPAEQLLKAELQGALLPLGVGLSSHLDVAMRIENVGERLTSQGRSVLQRFTGASLQNTAIAFQHKLVGERQIEALSASALKGMVDSLDQLRDGVANQSAAAVYLSLARLNFSVMTSSSPPQSLPSPPVFRTLLSCDVENLVDAHFIHGEYSTIDDFVDAWEPRSAQAGDVLAYALVTAIDSMKTPLARVLRALSTHSEKPRLATLQRIASSLAKWLREFAKAYDRNDLIAQYRAMTHLVTYSQRLRNSDKRLLIRRNVA
jgi:hypothetical protein